MSRVGGDEELLREIAGLFLEDYPEQLALIRRSLEAGDAHTLERAAHSLKGSVSNFGAEAVYQAAYAVEQIGRNQQLELAAPAVQALESALAALHGELVALSQS